MVRGHQVYLTQLGQNILNTPLSLWTVTFINKNVAKISCYTVYCKYASNRESWIAMLCYAMYSTIVTQQLQ